MALNTYPTADFVTSTLNGALTNVATSATIGTGLDLPAANGVLQVDYDSTTAVGIDNGPETIKYTAYNSGTGALTGITRGAAGTTGVAHANGASVACAPSSLYFLDLPKIEVGARAYLSADQDNLTFGVWTKVALDTESYDLGNDFAANKFVVPVDGIYLITGTVVYEGADLVADKSYAAAIYVNNAAAKSEQSLFSTPSSNRDLSVPVTDILSLSATDYIELFAMSYSGGNLTDIQSGESLTSLVVHLISKT